ncbi:MAG: ATP-dependent zinc metalloprotease FtsH [Sandaracinaceae bacterium]|nr:ATP-dependent zinc metalloprotease FtsH [Sandaracinaceae bacterium]
MKQSHKTLLLWVLLILMFVAIYQLVAAPETPRTVAWSDFVTDVRGGHVESVEAEVHSGSSEITYLRVEGDRREQRLTFGPATESDIRTMLEEHGVRLTFAPGDQNSVWTHLLVTWLPMIFLIAIFFFFMRQLQASGGKAMSFGKSRARLLNESQNKVTFADVAGIDEAKDDCEEIIAFLKDPKKFQRLGGRIPKGVLLMGPPGTGKTLLARAIAGEAGVPFFSISGSDFVEMFVGVGASRVRDLFEQGKKHAPCIIFIDEIDAVGRHRGSGLGGGHDEREQTLNQLLVEMDGFEASEGVIIIAATNRPDVLDPAILRPGRFDRRIVVPRPDLGGRQGILGVHTKKVPLADDVELDIIARGTPGFSGADIENLVNEAALLAARQDKDFVAMVDFELAKDKVLMGSERRSMAISEKQKQVTAWHEAGHTLIAWLLPSGDPVYKVTIIPRGPALGVTQTLPESDPLSRSKEWCEDSISMALGGRIAEELKFGELTSGAASDFQHVTNIARQMVTAWGMSGLGPMAFGDKDDSPFLMGPSFRSKDYSERTAQEIDGEVRRIVTEQYTRARALLEENRGKLDAIAEALLDRETLDRMELEALMEGRDLPDRERVHIPRYSEKRREQKEKRKSSIFQPRPREVPSGG